MAVRIDPTGEEMRALLSHAGDLTGRRVLEIGCGNGRLTRLYAGLAGQVVGIDPDPERVAQARRELPAELHSRVTFIDRGIDDFPLQDQFDLAILAWSL